MAKTLVLFLHGLRGKSDATWGDFEKLFLVDDQLKDSDIEFYGYDTPLYPIFSKALPIQDLASALKTEIDNRYFNYERLILVCHSLGGLVARKYVVEEVKSGRKIRVTNIILFATPNLGSTAAWWAAKIFPRQILFSQLSKNSDALQSINNDWSKLKCEDAVRTKYVRGGQDFFVDPLSVVGSTGVDVELMGDHGHSSLVKPKSCSDLGFLIVKNVVLSGQINELPKSKQEAAVYTGDDRSTRPPVLFEFYKPEYEPHYVARRADVLAEGYLRFQNIWIWGSSGFGKTCCLVRAFCRQRYNHRLVSLGHYSGADTRGLFQALLSELSVGSSAPLRMISEWPILLEAIVTRIAELGAISELRAILVEEIPLSGLHPVPKTPS